VGAAGGQITEERRGFGAAVVIRVMKCLDIIGTRDDDAALGIDGHRKNVVSQRVVRVQRDFKPWGHPDAMLVLGERSRARDEQHDKQAITQPRHRPRFRAVIWDSTTFSVPC
jgi:hypothetical protein